jgi:hypothetical protein
MRSPAIISRHSRYLILTVTRHEKYHNVSTIDIPRGKAILPDLSPLYLDFPRPCRAHQTQVGDTNYLAIPLPSS